MGIDMTRFKFGKPEPSVITKKRREKQAQKNERSCREIVRARDKGRCRVPNCNNRDVEMHHIIPRSRSAARKWDPANNCLLCRDHHRLRHAGTIQISGNADEELIITGDIDALRFRL